MKTRLSATLAATLLLAASLLSCAEPADVSDIQTNAPDNTPDTVAETEAVSKRPACNLPENLDFGGAAFHTIAFSWQGYLYYFFADEENGDIMNDAIYARTRAIEERLNVDLQHTLLESTAITEVPNTVKPTVLAGDDVYQQVLFHCIEGVSSFASQGYLYNLDEMPHIDINAEWWNKEQMDALRLGENTYFAVNDYMLPCPYIVYFSKDMVNDLEFEDPYQLVYDGRWTLDVFTQMARTVVSDLDGNGKMEGEYDRFGVTASEVSKYNSFVTGADQFITEKTSDGQITLAINTEKMLHIVEMFADLAKQDVCFMPQSEYEGYHLTLDTGRLLFDLETLTWAEKMRDYTVEFGFLPYPKYDEAQENYRSLDWGGLMGIPLSITDPELVGAVLELQAYESGNSVLPTYYDTVLTGKLARDENAVKMLDIVFDTICYEPGGNYFGFSGGFSDLFFALSSLSLTQKSADFASYYARQEKTALKTIEKFYQSLNDVELQ